MKTLRNSNIQKSGQNQMCSKKLNFGDLIIHQTPKDKRNTMKFFDSSEMARGRDISEIPTLPAPHYPPEGICYKKEDSLLTPGDSPPSDDHHLNETRKPKFGGLSVQSAGKEKRNGRKFFDSAEWAMSRGTETESLAPPRFPMEGVNQNKDDSILNANL